MPDPVVPSDVAELSERAADTHVVVIGGGLSGLVAARTFAKVGMRVTVLEAASHLGGTFARAELDGVTVDAAADSFTPGNEQLDALVEELGLVSEIVESTTQQIWLGGADAAPLPSRALAGIPDNPFGDEVRAIIGWRGAWRAYLDRLRPPLTIGQEESLGRLVETRMGKLVRDRLVAPLSLGVFGWHPDEISTDAAAPGLNAALTRTGSLSGAVATLIDDQARKAPVSLRGGMVRLVDALRSELEERGVEIRLNISIESLARNEAGWDITVDEEVITADAVFSAVPGDVAARLLPEDVPAPKGTLETRPVEVVTLLVESAALEQAPRGARVVTLPDCSDGVLSASHATASWAWLGEQLGSRHLLRVIFRASETEALSEAEAADRALAAASDLFGVPELSLVAAHRARYAQAAPASALGGAAERSAARTSLATRERLGVAGAWLAGSGLAQVVPDAVAEAERLRHELLWKDDTAN